MFVLPMFIEEAWKVPEEGNRTMFITLEKLGSAPWGNACGNTNCQLSVYCFCLNRWRWIPPCTFQNIPRGAGQAKTLKADPAAFCSVVMWGIPGAGCNLALASEGIQRDIQHPTHWPHPSSGIFHIRSQLPCLCSRDGRLSLLAAGRCQLCGDIIHSTFSYCLDLQGLLHQLFHASPLVY